MLVRKILEGHSLERAYRNSIVFLEDISYFGDNIFDSITGSAIWLDEDFVYYTPNPKEEISVDSSETYTRIHLSNGSDVYQIENYEVYRKFCRIHIFI